MVVFESDFPKIKQDRLQAQRRKMLMGTCNNNHSFILIKFLIVCAWCQNKGAPSYKDKKNSVNYLRFLPPPYLLASPLQGDGRQDRLLLFN